MAILFKDAVADTCKVIQPASGHRATAGIGSGLCASKPVPVPLSCHWVHSRSEWDSNLYMLTILMTFSPKVASACLPLPRSVHLCNPSWTSPKLPEVRDSFVSAAPGLLLAGQTFSKGLLNSPRLISLPPFLLSLSCLIPLPSFLFPLALSPLQRVLPRLKLVLSLFRESSAIVTKPASRVSLSKPGLIK